MVKTRPFPRFEREGLLGLSEDGQYFQINPALLEDLTSEMKGGLGELAICIHLISDERIYSPGRGAVSEANKPLPPFVSPQPATLPPSDHPV